MGRLPDAIAQLQIAVRLSPHALKPHSDLGTALAYAGRLPEAAAEFESALRIDPNDAIVQNNLAWRSPESPAASQTRFVTSKKPTA
jgi:Flp pilus assembly protein TadD